MEMKDSEMCMKIRFRRDSAGVKVTVQTSEFFENYMKSLGNGTAELVTRYGKLWLPEDATKPLEVWQADANLLAQLMGNGTRYRLDLPGKNLDLSGDYYQNTVNLSFLRLVGASKPDGITFTLKNQVYSLEGLRDLKDLIGKAAKNLYVEFMRPADLSINLTQIRYDEKLY